MSDTVISAEQPTSAVDALSAEDRAWLDARVAEYDELLEYLHDH